MGLKTTNYKKKSGVVLETAYAWIAQVNVGRQFSTAEFHINESRDNLKNHGADEIVYFTFPTDFSRPIAQIAYQKAKEPIKVQVPKEFEVDTIMVFDEFGNEVEQKITETRIVDEYIPNIFTGWEDDII